MRVQEFLQRKGGGAVVIRDSATVSDALGLLVAHNIGSLPVVDDQDHLVGIFTERDVLRGVHRDCESFRKARVGQVMTPDPVTCSPQDVIRDAMGLMSDRRVGQLPVVDGPVVVGVISVGDVVKLLYEQAVSDNRLLIEYVYGPV